MVVLEDHFPLPILIINVLNNSDQFAQRVDNIFKDIFCENFVKENGFDIESKCKDYDIKNAINAINEITVGDDIDGILLYMQIYILLNPRGEFDRINGLWEAKSLKISPVCKYLIILINKVDAKEIDSYKSILFEVTEYLNKVTDNKFAVIKIGVNE